MKSFVSVSLIYESVRYGTTKFFLLHKRVLAGDNPYLIMCPLRVILLMDMYNCSYPTRGKVLTGGLCIIWGVSLT